MAKAFLPLILLFFFFFFFAAAQQAAAYGGKVGGRTPVKNVESNQEIQDLGKYCVQEYNRQLQSNGSDHGKLLAFSRVVAAETQVVSGIKYYLRISAAIRTRLRTFDAVVVVKPWLRSRDLVSFAPSPAPTFTK